MMFKVVLILAFAATSFASTKFDHKKVPGVMEKKMNISFADISNFFKLHLFKQTNPNSTEEVTNLKLKMRTPLVRKMEVPTDEDEGKRLKPMMIAAFGVIIPLAIFFFLFYASWCCEINRMFQRNAPPATSAPRVMVMHTVNRPETPSPPPSPPVSPPPPYELFAPPSYEDVMAGRVVCQVVLVGVHAQP